MPPYASVTHSSVRRRRAPHAKRTSAERLSAQGRVQICSYLLNRHALKPENFTVCLVVGISGFRRCLAGAFDDDEIAFTHYVLDRDLRKALELRHPRQFDHRSPARDGVVAEDIPPHVIS